ncbi:MAG: SRPBCC family protein [Thermodesulfobacteriota bacterium]
MDAPEHRTRDEALIPAPIHACFAALADLATYARWWTLVRVVPLGAGTLLAPGVRFRFVGGRPGGAELSWEARVLELDEPRRIELAYVAGELLGRTAWELASEGAATRVAYVYRGVRANGAASAASFARFGTRLHNAAMQEDALAGLARYLGGAGCELDDEAWRREVGRRVAARLGPAT